MKNMPTACCLLAGLAIAASGTASAQDARPDKPPMSIEQRKALGEAMAQRNRDLKPPRPEAEALPTLVRRPEGGESMEVPTELWTTLPESKDAQRGHRITEERRVGQEAGRRVTIRGDPG